MAENLPIFKFYRTFEVVEHNRVKGNRGILQVNGRLYFTIERDIDRYVDIPIGTYKLKMEYSPTKKIGNESRKQFRIKGHNVPAENGGLANLLIHQGKYPGGLKGCIAPGKMMISGGIDQSDLAMEELFNVCGGFEEKEEAAILEVLTKPFVYDPIGTYPTQ